jgi:hypothetical protein
MKLRQLPIAMMVTQRDLPRTDFSVFPTTGMYKVTNAVGAPAIASAQPHIAGPITSSTELSTT